MAVSARSLVPVLIGLGLVGLLVYQLVSQGSVRCRVCVVFQGERQCASAAAPDEARAREEAQRSACSLMTSGVQEAFACPQVAPDSVSCKGE